MFFRRFRLSAGHLKKVLPGFSTAQDSTSSLIAVGLLSLCGLMQDFTEQLHLDRYTLFMQDYGGPVGFRMALAHLRHPDRSSTAPA
jgi:pimeloyl-ACP methyl ester carboxylesterase